MQMGEAQSVEMIRNARRLAEESFLKNSGYARAIDAAHAAVAQARQEAHQQNLADALDALGLALYYQVIGTDWGDLQQAYSNFQKALELHRNHQNPCGTAESLFHIGMLYVRQSEFEQARSAFDEARPIAEEHHCRQVLSDIMRHIGFARLYAGDVNDAKECFRQSLALREEIADPVAILFAHLPLADLAIRQSDLALASHHHETALRIAEQLKYPVPLFFTWYSMAQLEDARHDLTAARQAYTEARHYARAANNARGIALCEEKLRCGH